MVVISDANETEQILQAAKSGDLIAYFGYGSLVNRETLRTKIVGAKKAKLKGWQRCWLPRDQYFKDNVALSLLSVVEDDVAEIGGLLVFDWAKNLGAVDAREEGYQRHVLSKETISLFDPLDAQLLNCCPLYIYQAQADTEDRKPAILQSYLDAVLKGFLVEHGAEGVHDFVKGTRNFDRPIHPDRAQPIYPRSIQLDGAEINFIDTVLSNRALSYTYSNTVKEC